MNHHNHRSAAQLWLATFAIALAFCGSAIGQTPAPAAAEKASLHPAAPADEIEQLRREVEVLRTLVQQDRDAIAELRNQLAAVKAIGPRAAELAGAAMPDDAKDATAGGKPSGPPEAQAGNQAPEKKEGLVAGWDGNHAFLRSADGAFETTIGGYAQLDFHGYQAGNHPPNTFLIRRARLDLQGRLMRYIEFRLEGDFADLASTQLRDGWVRLHRYDEVQFTFGQFREPFSQEEMRPDAVQDFVERSVANNLAPSRQPGLMVSGVLHHGTVEYQLGVFNGKGLLAVNNTGTPDTAFRMRFAPWKNSSNSWVKGLLFGGAGAYGRNNQGLSVCGVTESRSTIFFAPEIVQGPLWRANGELTWLLGPLAIRAEYDQTNQERRGLGPHGTTLPGVLAKGYTGQVTYLLTGEEKPDNGVLTPRRSVFGDEKSRGWGAFELKFRYSYLDINDGSARRNRVSTYYFGPNWYLNKFVRYLLDFGVERFQDPLRTPRPGERNFFVVLSRVQFSF